MAARTDVQNSFGPPLPKSKLIRKEDLREFLLTKLLNAEYACHNAPQFKDKMVSQYLDQIHFRALKSRFDTLDQTWTYFRS